MTTDQQVKRIYVASSWRNPLQPSVVALLREFGHEVYDFRNPAPDQKGFAWRDCISGVDAKTIPSYLQVIRSDRAEAGFGLDKNALDWCDTCVIVLPCGRSAHLEAGYAAGQGKKVYVLLHETQFEPELMYLLCTGITADVMQVVEWLQSSPRAGTGGVADCASDHTMRSP
jgi:nucleoside 2-deoxyribosyltransferase